MVDIERKGITLSDWIKGISVDEYAGGSYYYAEGIQSDYCTKGFKLAKYANSTSLNIRNSGYVTAMSPMYDAGILGDMLCFESDGKIETNGHCSGLGYYDGDGDLGGALYSRRGSYGYVNGIIHGDKAIGITRNKVDVIKYDFPYDWQTELVANPTMSDPGSSWTIGEGWTVNQYGILHTPGYTGTLSCNITIPEAGRYRVAVCIRNVYNGRVTITGMGYNMRTGTKEYGRFVFNSGDRDAGQTTLTITPSSDFDGYIEIVNIHPYDGDNAMEDKATITTADVHPICLWQGDLYIGSGSKIDILNLVYYDVETKSIIDDTYKIVNITQQAGNLIIWATDGFNSKQYYWNGVDATASEVIERPGLTIKGVASSETVSYVTTLDNGVYRVFAVNGYQRSLLSISNAARSDYNLTRKVYNKDKKFAMNHIDGPNSMGVVEDSLYVAGCKGLYKYGTEVPGLAKNWNRVYLNGSGYELYNVVIGSGKKGVYMARERNYEGRVNNITYFDNNYYCYNGYVVTNPIYWDKIGTRKSIEKLKIGYKNGAAVSTNSEVNIKIYAIVDDDYFWRYKVSGVTNRPEIGDIYRVSSQTNAKIIDIEKTGVSDGVITLATVERKSQGISERRLTRITGNGDSTIDSNYENDNMFLIKTITNENVGYYSDFIFGENFVDSYIPYWHKIQFVIELNSDYNSQTPEIYELSMTADIADTTI